MICVLKRKSGQPIALFKNLLTTSLCKRPKSKVLVLRKPSLFVTWCLCLSGLFFCTLSPFLCCPTKPTALRWLRYTVLYCCACFFLRPWVQSLGWEDPLEEGMATHSGILARRISMDREVCWATVMGWQRVRHNWLTKHYTWLTWKEKISLEAKHKGNKGKKGKGTTAASRA